jgi:ATP-dependent exoDNAse (exonuclease V) beta subunit
MYNAIAKYFIIEKYSAYDFRDEIPNEIIGNKRILEYIKRMLASLDEYLKLNDVDEFENQVKLFANYLGYETKNDHCKKLFETIIDKKYHSAFNIDGLNRIAITFHSSKGLEFDQLCCLYPTINFLQNRKYIIITLQLHEQKQN